jgi:hypothetical protein
MCTTSVASPRRAGICLVCHGIVAPDERQTLIKLAAGPADDLVIAEALLHLGCVALFERRPGWRLVAQAEYVPRRPRRMRSPACRGSGTRC